MNEVERCPESKAFLGTPEVIAAWKNTWLEAIAAVRIQGDTPMVATREVAQAAQVDWRGTEPCEIVIERLAEGAQETRGG